MRTYGLAAANEHQDATATITTGIHGQVLNINGWFASHADTGRPGPHIHLSTGGSSNMRGAVLRTSQVPELVDCLNLVAERIDKQWERHGDDFLRTFGDEPDDNDPAVIRQRRVDHLLLNQQIAAHITEIVDLVVQADDIHDATESIAALLDVDEMALQVHLQNFSLFGLTRATRAAQVEQLQELREQP
jgi:hypothetical protein